MACCPPMSAPELEAPPVLGSGGAFDRGAGEYCALITHRDPDAARLLESTRLHRVNAGRVGNC